MIPVTDIINILQVYQDNPTLSRERIAKKLLISKRTVKTVFDNNLLDRRSKMTDSKESYILGNLKKPIKDIAKNIDMPLSSVYKFLRSRNINREKLFYIRLDR